MTRQHQIQGPPIASTNDLHYEIAPSRAGALPHTDMIDRDGKTQVLPGVADLSTVRARLESQAKPRHSGVVS